MIIISLEDVEFPEIIQDAYRTCKYLERKGVSLEAVTLGNVHDAIEEAIDDNQLHISQVVNDRSIEGYLIEA